MASNETYGFRHASFPSTYPGHIFFMSIVTALKAGTIIYLTNTLLCVVHLECFQMFTIFIYLYIVVYNYHSG